MSFLANDPQLFLHKGKDGVVRVLRCKKETTLFSLPSMLMKPEDFIDEGIVTNHLTISGGYYNWDKTQYDALIDYIYTRHLLVNCHGSLIVELTTDDQIKAPPLPVVTNLFYKQKREAAAAAASPVQLVYIRALDILDMRPYSPHPANREVPARTVKYIQDGTVVQTEPNPKEMKLTQDLAIKSKQVETLQQEVESLQQELLAKEKSEKEALIKRVAELKELANSKSCGTTAAPPSTVRIYTKADSGYSLTIRNGDQVIVGPNDESDVCQYWVKDDKYGAIVKDVCGFPGYALVNKFTGQALKPPIAAATRVELVPYNPNVLDKTILWSEHEQGDGYRAIRNLTFPSLNLDAFVGDGVVGDGTVVGVWNWLAGNNQKWNIVPYIHYERVIKH